MKTINITIDRFLDPAIQISLGTYSSAEIESKMIELFERIIKVQTNQPAKSDDSGLSETTSHDNSN